MRVLNLIKNFNEEAKKVLEEIGEIDFLDLTQNQLMNCIKDYDILLVGLGLNIDKEIIDQACRLKVIATATTGLDHIDVNYAEDKNIVVLSLKGETEFLNSVTGTAELAFGLLINLARKIFSSVESVRNFQWEREKFEGYNLSGKTLGIVGYGRLGKMMARYGQAFGMKVIVNDPYFKGNEVENIKFTELLERSDFISIHVHLQPETKHLFNLAVFKKMKRTAFLINTSRGGVVNERDIAKALEMGLIAGYAADVLEGELDFASNFSNYPLVEYAKENDNCIITPHIGGMTYESRATTDKFIVDKLKNWLNSK